MSLDIITLLTIVSIALVLFIGGWIRVDLVGLLVLSALALTNLVTTQEALSGFSSPAVVTVWALFILSAGLTRTGIAHQIGKPLQHFAKSSEVVLMVVLMVAASLLSALINTVTVAAIMLPSTMELARRSGRSPSRLLMPLALGCLLGGPFTGISTPPNILVTDALRNAGLSPFAIFDFTPITAAIVASGIIFMVVIGRRLLPSRVVDADAGSLAALRETYQFDSQIVTARIISGSVLHGLTLAESRLGLVLHLTVLGLERNGVINLAPKPDEVLQEGDTIIAYGSSDFLRRYQRGQHLKVESSDSIPQSFFRSLLLAEGTVAKGSPLLGTTLAESGLRREHRVHVRTLHSASGEQVRDPRQWRFAEGDRLLLQGAREALEAFSREGMIARLRFLDETDMAEPAGEHVELLPVRVPLDSVLAGFNLADSRMGNDFGLTVVGMVRDGETVFIPSPDEQLLPDDLLIFQGTSRDLKILEGMPNLEITEQSPELVAELESQHVGVTEVLLSPRTTLAGKTLAELRFRDRYGISVLAVWRKGHASHLKPQDMPLQFGDALLVYGQRNNLDILARDPDFLVLDKAAAQAPRLEKAGISAGIMIAVILSAILGFVPISIAAIAGASLMVLAGCLSMEEAYRAIEWKVVFLIACMLPLGAAIENTGAAQMAAKALIDAVGDMGPRWVVAALFSVTVLGTQIIPTAALVVLMTPVALSTASTLGISPYLLMMTVAISASASFASPLSHPAHLLVMGPGGYRFIDYVKVGVPITLLALIVSVWLLPIMWPPYPGAV